jgi:hypothetical protein
MSTKACLVLFLVVFVLWWVGALVLWLRELRERHIRKEFDRENGNWDEEDGY